MEPRVTVREWLRREEIRGREGGEPPILIRFSHRQSGRFLGWYARTSMAERPFYHGPMFRGR